MKKFLIVSFFISVSWLVCAEVDPRINSYNEFFEKKDYEKALSVAEEVIASFPDVMEFHREKAKMLAATNQKEKFFEEMLVIRGSQQPGSIKCFFDALSHDLVSKEFRDDLRRLFFQRKDTEILLSWPQFSTDKEIVVSKVYVGEERPNEDFSQNSFSQPDNSRVSQSTPESSFATNHSANSSSSAYSNFSLKQLGDKAKELIRECMKISALLPESSLEFEVMINTFEQSSNKMLALYYNKPKDKDYDNLERKILINKILKMESFISKWNDRSN